MTNSTNKSFILHTDSLDILPELSDIQAGKIFKAIYNYQKIGQDTKLDQTLRIVMMPLIHQFKRDEEKYLNSIIQGKLGNLKKYHKKIYQRIIDGQINLEEGEKLAYPEKSIKSIHCRPPITPDQVGSLNLNINTNINNNIISLQKDFEKVYRLYNSDKKIKVIPFDNLKTKFEKCLKTISLEELEKNISDYLDYLSIATWRKKKAFEAWINSSECFANDWVSEKQQEQDKTKLNNSDSSESQKIERPEKDILREKILDSGKPSDYNQVMNVLKQFSDFGDYRFFEDDKFFILVDSEKQKEELKNKIQQIEIALFKLKQNQCHLRIISKSYFNA